MSFFNKITLSGNSLQAIQPTIGAQVSPIANKIFILGDGLNLYTQASGNSVTAHLFDDIEVTKINSSHMIIEDNSIYVEDGALSTDIIFSLSGTAYLEVSYANQYSGAGFDADKNLVSTESLLDGQLVIGTASGAPVAGYLTAGPGIEITNGSGSITIGSADSSNVGIEWSVQTYTGTGSRTYTAYPNNGYIADSTVGTLNILTGGASYCPASPIIYYMAPTDQWSVGDVVWFVNRNKGGYYVQFLAGQLALATFPLPNTPWNYNAIFGSPIGNGVQKYANITAGSGVIEDFSGTAKAFAFNLFTAISIVYVGDSSFVVESFMGNTNFGDNGTSSVPVPSQCIVV